ncbi:MAG: protein-glutamate O-methyltransferase [Kiloniellales bacterium]|nr:protein-glutamate O-methyltransferase [Kiloniellales bacterium]
MNIDDFNLVAKILKDRSGLVLGSDKAYLLESRLNPVARKYDLAGVDDLVAMIRAGGNEKLLVDITEAMTTNESFFFRDQKPFDQFRDLVLPYMLDHRSQAKTLRIWCAACSSGQEPYSLAMLLKEQAAGLAGWTIEILATDLSLEILSKAKEGIYSQFEVQRGLPVGLLVKYFKQDGERWQISDEIRSMVSFKPHNLLHQPQGLQQVDVVFCRNVLIYFDPETKTTTLDSISNVMAEDGFLFLGGAETVLGVSERFQLIPGQRGVYGPTGGAGSLATGTAA